MTDPVTVVGGPQLTGPHWTQLMTVDPADPIDPGPDPLSQAHWADPGPDGIGQLLMTARRADEPRH